MHCDIAYLERGGGGSVKFNSIKLLKIGLGPTANTIITLTPPPPPLLEE